MKIFKCLSQNVSVLQDKEEKPERRKYLLDFRHKKRRLLDNRTKECSSNGGGFNSAFKENDDLLLAGNIGSIVKTKYAAIDNSVKSASPRSKNEEKLSPRDGGALVASKEKRHLKTYKTLPTVQSTPVAAKCRSGNVEDSQGFSFDATANSNTSVTTAFFRKMNINMSDYLPSFAVYESPKDRPDESNGKCSPDGNWLNVALLTSKSSDSCGYSSSNCSVPFAFYNSAVEWSSLANNTSSGTESTVNSSTTTCNKGCSTSSDFESSNSFASARSIPVTFIPGNTRRKRLQFTTRSDTRLTTPANRRDHYQKHTKVDTHVSVEEHDPMEIACDSSRRVRDTNNTVIATSVCTDSISQVGLGCDSISFTDIDYDYSSIADQDSKLFKKNAPKKAAHTSVCYDSVSQAGRDCDSMSSTGIDYDYSSTADQDSNFFNKTYNTSVCYESVSRAGDSVSFTGIDCDYSSVAHQDSRFSNNGQVTTQAVKAKSVSHSVSRAGRGFDSISSTGIDYDCSSITDAESRFFDKKRVVQQAPHTSVCYETVSQAKRGCDSINFTGIDYDYSITADQDSRIFAKEQATQQVCVYVIIVTLCFF